MSQLYANLECRRKVGLQRAPIYYRVYATRSASSSCIVSVKNSLIWKSFINNSFHSIHSSFYNYCYRHALFFSDVIFDFFILIYIDYAFALQHSIGSFLLYADISHTETKQLLYFHFLFS